VIVVLGRPQVQRLEPDGPLSPSGLAADVAMSLARAGVTVELAGSLGDDPEGDHVVVALGRAGVGHAALLRDPAARTPSRGAVPPGRALPRLEAADVGLALSYLPECRVLVLADELEAAARAQALAAAEFHAADVVMVAAAGSVDPASLDDRVTLLERSPLDEPTGVEDDEAPAAAPDDAAFVAFVADYAARLERGEAPESAFSAALGGGAWESSPD